MKARHARPPPATQGIVTTVCRRSITVVRGLIVVIVKRWTIPDTSPVPIIAQMNRATT